MADLSRRTLMLKIVNGPEPDGVVVSDLPRLRIDFVDGRQQLRLEWGELVAYLDRGGLETLINQFIAVSDDYSGY